MCGIAGIAGEIGVQDATLRVQSMMHALQHRGPDAAGSWTGDGVVFGHTRLKILDLSEEAAQPMLSEDGRIALIYNGEIYNHHELRSELSGSFNWRSRSDTEVLLRAYQTWGISCISRLNGMFAFALWDDRKKILYLARDRFGIKPLYYYKSGSSLEFASEIKGLLAGGVPAVPCYEKIHQFLRWGALDYDSRTWFQDIHSLPAGHILTFKDKQMTVSPYYRLEDHIDEGASCSGNKFYELFKETLSDAVKLQLQADREAGIHLSGGVDSSLLAAAVCKTGKTEIQSYTFGYEESQYDERPSAKAVAEQLGFQNQSSVLIAADAQKLLLQTLREEDEPFTSFRQISHHKLYKDFASAGATVILEASGGDEIGAGYTSYMFGACLDTAREQGPLSALEQMKTTALKNFSTLEAANIWLLGSALNYESAGLSTSDGTPCVDKRFLEQSFADKYLEEVPHFRKPFQSALRNQQYLDIIYAKLPRGLRYIERASMAAGREARLPLLDHRLVELGLSASNDQKVSKDGTTRVLFQKLLKDLMPSRIQDTNKKSIADPQRRWMTHELSDFVSDVFTSKHFRERGLFNVQEIQTYWKSFKAEDPTKNSLTLFQPLITELWFSVFLDKVSSYE